jgi:predicted nuclease of predicted toxin-antitoxin system
MGQLFITLDLDFADVRRFVPGTHPGILLLRCRSKSGQDVLGILRRVLLEQPLEALQGCLVVADSQRTRIRRPSSPQGECDHKTGWR